MDETGKGVVGLYAFPWRQQAGGFKGRFIEGRRNKANPRDAAYMRALLAEKLPEATFVDTDSDPTWQQQLDGADALVLLYPDPLGLGMQKIDVAAFASGKELTVLNGRRRLFSLDEATYRQIRRNRFWERTMLPELAATMLFLLATPFLLIADWGRGKW